MGAAWVLVNGGEIVSGRTFTNAEYAAGAHVAVINDKLAEGLFARGVDPIGKRIKVFGEPFTVIGVHVEAASLFGGGDQVRMAIPHTAFVKIADYWKGWMDISVLPTESATSLEAQEEVISAMRAKRGLKPMQENNFAVLSQDKILDTFNSITAGFFAVMVALSGVGLMVGGVGVVAIMMISVTERTREIGVRKALGATKREIMFQFLVEAATLTLVGGAIGLALGALIAVGHPVRIHHPGERAALVDRGLAARLDRHGRALRPLPGVPRRAARSGGGAALRVGDDGETVKGRRRRVISLLTAFPFSFLTRSILVSAMSFLESLRIAFDSIWSAKLRSFFTLLGIIVSVAFLVVVVAVIQGMNAYVKENLTGAMIGTNAFQVRRTPITVGLLDDEMVKRIARRPIITSGDAETVRRAIPDAEAVSLQSGWPTPINDVGYRNRTVGSVLDLRGDPALPAGPGLHFRRRRTPRRSRCHRAAARGGAGMGSGEQAVRPARRRRWGERCGWRGASCW